MAHSARTPMPQAATLQDFLAIPEHQRFHEILDGQLVRKTMPNGHHGMVQGRLRELLGGYDDGSLHRQRGGWWLMSEVEILLPWGQVVRPDLAGWRCERLPEVTTEFPLRLRPDWICEVVSPSDTAEEVEANVFEYLAAGTAAVWVVYPRSQRVTVHTPDGLARTYGLEATLTMPDLLPGFSLLIKELFV